MKDPVSRVLAVLALFLAAGTAFLLFGERGGREEDAIQKELALYRRVRDVIREEYVRDVEGGELLRNTLKGMLNGLDPYSEYYDPKEEEELKIETAGKFVGIGIVVEVRSPALTVLFPQPGSPAEEAGIAVGDRILSIDGVPTEGTTVEQARQRIRGEAGTEALLRLRPGSGGPERKLGVRRESLRDPTVARARILDRERGIGYLWVGSFSQETLQEFDQAVERLKSEGLRALILDLRFNPGGVLDPAVGIVNRFLREGLIVSTRGRSEDATREHRADPEGCLLEGMPLAVLINGESASASEVLAGAVQDQGLGRLVGATSYGKGVVQSLRRWARTAS